MNRRKIQQVPDEPLPKHLREPPREHWEWPMPTSWLLGTKLLGSLRDILLSSVAKVDQRAWMSAGDVIDLTDETEPFYLDFLADTGDSQQMVYQLATLLVQPELKVRWWQNGEDKVFALPRGALLVIGGDTAYPVATHRRLLERIRAPFKWAHDRAVAADPNAFSGGPVKLVAVPGNHDYYDGLRGFEGLVHSPPVQTWTDSTTARVPAEQALTLPGYEVVQHASYFALALPHDWRLWGLDIENAVLDPRQAAYFRGAESWPNPPANELTGAPTPPDRLIFVTSRPAFVYQGPSDHADVIKASMAKLGIQPAFDKHGVLDSHKLRLDLSGDVHLYERYWGTDHHVPDDVDTIYKDRKPRPLYEPPERYTDPETVAAATILRKRGNDDVPRKEQTERENYASVVSGLGGTFHHPSQVRMGRTAPRTSWPSQLHSAREVGVRLVDPYQIFRAGAVGIVGLLLSLLRLPLLREPNANALDLPFAWRDTVAGIAAAVTQFGLVAACVGIALLMILMPSFAFWLGRRWARPIHDMTEPGWWPRLTRSFAYAWGIRHVLRFFGANLRTSWLFFTTLPTWCSVPGLYFLGGWLRQVNRRVGEDTPMSLYVVTTILVVGMFALGWFRAGQKRPFESVAWNLVRRTVFAALGTLVSVLVVCTPYLWTRMVCCNRWIALLGLAVVVATLVVRVGKLVFRRNLRLRRLVSLVCFAALIAGAVVPPLWTYDPAAARELHVLAYVLSFFFGAYFACLWSGWYFCICLQWNAHGNEAGGAARVTRYGEFIRIKLTRDHLEAWTIAVEPQHSDHPPRLRKLFGRETLDLGKPPTARLIDHFILGRKPTP